MRRLMSLILLIMISISILAEGTANIEKEVSGVNKNTTTEGREILKGEEKDPTLEKVDLNLVENQDQNIETKNIEYNQEEPNDEILAEITESKAKPNYWLWGGLGALVLILVAGAAGN